MLFGGFYLNQGSVPVWLIWFQYISYFKYSFEGLSLAFWEHTGDIPGCSAPNATCPASGKDMLKQLSMENGSLWVDCVVMVAMFFAYRLLAYLSLLIRSYKK